MKKLFAGIITTMLVVAMMGTTVFAALSPSSDTALRQEAESLSQKITSVTAIGASNSAVAITVTTLDTTEMTQANAKVQSDYKNATILAMADLSIPEGTDLTNGIRVTLSVSGILAGDNIKVLHQKSGGDWETLDASAGNGTVTVTMQSFSPIVIIRLPVSSSTGSTGTTSSSTGSTGTTSSSTGSTGTTGNSTGSTGTTGSSTGNNGNTGNTNNNSANTNTSNSSGTQNTDSEDSSNGSSKKTTVNSNTDSSYGDGYKDGYTAGKSSATGTSTSSNSTGGSSVVRSAASASSGAASATSPKTGQSFPAMPVIAVLALAGIIVCGRKARNI
jgi:hypothetical protein